MTSPSIARNPHEIGLYPTYPTFGRFGEEVGYQKNPHEIGLYPTYPTYPTL
jgi:hypothetical protein